MKPMTDTALVRRYEALDERMSKLIDRLIAAGHGALRFEQLREKAHAGDALCAKYVSMGDEKATLRAEAERRYGPGLMMVRQLVWK